MNLQKIPCRPEETVGMGRFGYDWSGTVEEAIRQGRITQESIVQEGEFKVFYHNRVAIARIRSKSPINLDLYFFDPIASAKEKPWAHMDAKTRRFNENVELLVPSLFCLEHGIVAEI